MKKAIFVLGFISCSIALFGQQLPLNKIAPHRFVYFQESTGRAIVNNENLTYWLYQCTPDDMDELIGYIHTFVENLGYTVDYDSFTGIYENPNLATSVKSLMSVRKRNISITIWNDALIINIDIEGNNSNKPLLDRKYYFMRWSLIR